MSFALLQSVKALADASGETRPQAAEQLSGLVCFMFEATSPDGDPVAAAAAVTSP